jgi:predicted nucleotidyltransferase
MTIKPVRDYTPYLKYARELTARRKSDPHLIARRERAWIVAREIAAFLRVKYQPTRLVVFGSLVHPELFHARSDIDIAVDGIPWLNYLRAWNDVEKQFTEFKVDLIDVGIVSPEMREWIDEDGQSL